MKPSAVLAVLIAASFAPSSLASEAECSAPLAAISTDGRVSAGSKEAVLQAFRAGLPLRVGWSLFPRPDGTPELSHWADAGFTSEFEGEIFAQIQDIQRQAPERGRARVGMPGGRLRWSGLIGTTGVLESHFDDGSLPTSMRVATRWCVDPRATACAPQWRLVYRHDAEGAPLAGSREALLDAFRRGQALRLGWGMKVERNGQWVQLEHVAEPVFASLVGGRDLFVQLPEHVLQTSYHEPSQDFGKPSVAWRGLMGTTGRFEAVMVDRASGEEVRRLPQKAAIAWFAYGPAPDCAPPPVELAIAGGVALRK